jgi:hypothetical protein
MTSESDSEAIPSQLRSRQLESIGDPLTESFVSYPKWLSNTLPNGDVAKTSVPADLKVTPTMHRLVEFLRKGLIVWCSEAS